MGAPSSKPGNPPGTSISAHESPGCPDSAEPSINVHLALLSSALDLASPGVSILPRSLLGELHPAPVSMSPLWRLHPAPVPVSRPVPLPVVPTRCPLPRLRTAKGPVESPANSGAAESPGAGPRRSLPGPSGGGGTGTRPRDRPPPPRPRAVPREHQARNSP